MDVTRTNIEQRAGGGKLDERMAITVFGPARRNEDSDVG
jgi:hypothetical protein